LALEGVTTEYGMTDAPPGPHVLALNSGSSSLKFGLYRVRSSQVDTLIAAEAEAIGQGESRFHAQDARRNVLLSKNISMPDLRNAIVRFAALLVELTMPAALAIGHRIVPGGPKLRRHCLIDASVLSAIEAAIAFAPLQIPLVLLCHSLIGDPGRTGALSRASPGGMLRCRFSCRLGGCCTYASDCQGTARGGHATLGIPPHRANRSCAS
jgi:hypothetical protein